MVGLGGLVKLSSIVLMSKVILHVMLHVLTWTCIITALEDIVLNVVGLVAHST